MPRRQPDVIKIESAAGDASVAFSRFASLEITNDLLGATEAVFEVGAPAQPTSDSASSAPFFRQIARVVAPGRPFKVYLNNRLRMTGRAEVNDVKAEGDRGFVMRVTCRTKMADARFASAAPGTAVQNTTVEKFVRTLYEQIGVTGDALVFDPGIKDAELMTGKSLGGGAPVPDVIPIDAQQAAIQPPESIAEAVDRHLKRFSASHWDGPAGDIIIGRPSDTQRPVYRLLAHRDAGRANNVLSFSRVRDWTDLPRSVRVYGQTYGKDVTSSQFKGEAEDSDVAAVAARAGRHFDRLVILQDQQSKSADAALGAAKRELAQRLGRKDAWEFEVDGWSYWNGSEQIPWAPNTVADVWVDGLEVPRAGAYFITRTVLKLDLDGGATTTLSLVKPGTWRP